MVEAIHGLEHLGFADLQPFNDGWVMNCGECGALVRLSQCVGHHQWHTEVSAALGIE